MPASNFERYRIRQVFNGVRQNLDTPIKNMNDTAGQPCSEKVIDYVTAQWRLISIRKNIDAAFTNFDLDPMWFFERRTSDRIDDCRSAVLRRKSARARKCVRKSYGVAYPPTACKPGDSRSSSDPEILTVYLPSSARLAKAVAASCMKRNCMESGS